MKKWRLILDRVFSAEDNTTYDELVAMLTGAGFIHGPADTFTLAELEYEVDNDGDSSDSGESSDGENCAQSQS